MATSLTSGKLTVNNLGLMDWKKVTYTRPDPDLQRLYQYYLPSGGNWICIVMAATSSVDAAIGFKIKAGGSSYAAGYSDNPLDAYAIRFS